MTPSHAAAAFTLACALAASAAEPPAARDARPAIELPTRSDDQQQALAAWSRTAFCYCGCPHTVEQCLREHKTCQHAHRMMVLAARLLRAGAKKEELPKLVAAYYASFDKRAKIDLAKFGPPRGGPNAKGTLVEWSDFTCPYCQMVRPALESFVEARAARVKLFYKPYPIESHPGALELAQAGEWARDAKIFWPMHDALFANPRGHSPDELAELASDAGGDPDSLREALESGKYVAKIRDSQAEARAAGLKGTPSLFLNGRLLGLGDYSDEGLEFTLQDEEEWTAHGGWQKD